MNSFINNMNIKLKLNYLFVLSNNIHYLRKIELFLHNIKLHLRFQEIVCAGMAICFTNNIQINKFQQVKCLICYDFL